MYINVGMANREKRPKQERDDIRFTHIAIPTSFYIFLISILVIVMCAVSVRKQASARWQSSESG